MVLLITYYLLSVGGLLELARAGVSGGPLWNLYLTFPYSFFMWHSGWYSCSGCGYWFPYPADTYYGGQCDMSMSDIARLESLVGYDGTNWNPRPRVWTLCPYCRDHLHQPGVVWCRECRWWDYEEDQRSLGHLSTCVWCRWKCSWHPRFSTAATLRRYNWHPGWFP